MRHVPYQATCVVCMKRKQCVTKRILDGGELRMYDNFAYSEKHRGWMCKKCARQLAKDGNAMDVPEILRKP